MSQKIANDKYCTVSPGKAKLIPLLLFVFALLLAPAALAQQMGSISGKIVDKSNNEPLIGANVLTVGTKIGAISDLDGHFTLRNLAPGVYQIRFSFISYQTLTVQEVTVNAGSETKINVSLIPSSIQLKEVLVTAEALKTSELAVINIQKNASSIVDGMSAEMITKNSSTDGTDVLKRMTGVTISEGKYAFVRGVGDRYNSTLLNGSSLPSTDPEKKSFSYDMFPASLIETLLTSKTATPDKPADFSGGLIEINTVEFPAKFMLSVSGSSSYDTQTHFKDFITYAGGDLDWLGIDDGTRQLPGLISSQKVSRGNLHQSQLQTIGLAFKNDWRTTTTSAPMKGSLKISLGNSVHMGDNLLGYIASFNYSNSDKTTKLVKNNYTFEGPRYLYNGYNYANSVNWSGMFNTSFKLGSNHKFSLKNIYNQNADNETTIYEGPYYYNPDYRKVTALRFISRSLYSSQLIGQHHFSVLQGLGVDWNVNYGLSERNEPDARRYVYTRDLMEPDAQMYFLLDQSVSTRFFGDLQDDTRGANINLTIKPFKNPSLPNFKLGYLYDNKDRVFKARTFGFRNLPGGNFMAEDQLMNAPVEQIFAPENFNDKFIEVVEITKCSDSYSSDQWINAGYLMTNFDVAKSLKFVAGVRYEESEQNLHSFSITNEPTKVQHHYRDWLPSINATYAPSEKINLRAAYSKTLARPEFRELAPFSYFDFLANELVQGNINLKRSRITNLDLRLEYYPKTGELLAISGFHKKFVDPIEQILIAASGFEPIRSYENADQAMNYGVELEIRKKLDFVSPRLANFSFVSNVSLIQSEIDLKGNNLFQEDKRPLQGQADYVSNVGLYYENFTGSSSASVIYNRVGERISRVGFANLGDIIELPRNQIDVSVSQKLSDHLHVKFTAKDLLNQDHKFIQRTLEGDKPAEVLITGRILVLGFSYEL